jgi:hypothetical protein
MRRPSPANIRRLDLAEQHRATAGAPRLIAIVIESREQLARLNSAFGEAPDFAGPWRTLSICPPLDERDTIQAEAMFEFLGNQEDK